MPPPAGGRRPPVRAAIRRRSVAVAVLSVAVLQLWLVVPRLPSVRSAAPASPPPGPALMAQDVNRGPHTALDDVLLAGDGSTWTFDPDALTWAERQDPANGPGARADASMAFDGSTVVLFGGKAGGQYLGDTWEWDGTTWHQRFPTASPPARAGAAMMSANGASGIVYNANPQPNEVPLPANGYALLFGGETKVSGCDACPATALGDTWEWSNGAWTPAAPGPSPRSYAGMAPGPGGAVILFGGHDAQGSPLNDDWTWNDPAWSPGRPPPPLPSPRSRAALGYDGNGCGATLFSGADGSPNDTWLLGPLGWAQLAVSQSPPARQSAAVGYALGLTPNVNGGAAEIMVLYGGTAPDGTPLGDTWTLEPTWTARYPCSTPTWTLVNDGSGSSGGTTSSSSSSATSSSSSSSSSSTTTSSSSTSDTSSSTSTDGGSGGCPAAGAGPGQVLYPAGYSLVGLPRGTVVASDSRLYGWLDEGNGGRYFSQDQGQPVEGSVGYWAWFACPHAVTLSSDGAPSASWPLHAYHASMVGNPSTTGPVTVSGFDYAARWDPQAGTYRISRYRSAQSLAVGEAIWVFSYVDTTVRISG